jgi:hypothetical protein
MTLITYPEISGIPQRHEFSVRIRQAEQDWHSLTAYEANVDMHNVRQASFVSFDMEGPVEVEITVHAAAIDSAVIRPLSYQITFEQSADKLYFQLDQPRKLSIEINGERFSNLHLFANPIEHDAPDPASPNIVLVKPGIHRSEHLLRPLTTPRTPGEAEPDVLYFLPGLHYIEETLLRIPSGKTVYIAGGAAVAGSMVCDHVEDVTVRGRGFIYLAEFHRFTAFRGVRIMFSRNIAIEGITTINPPHYSIYISISTTYFCGPPTTVSPFTEAGGIITEIPAILRFATPASGPM